MGMSIDKAIEHGKEQLEIFGGEHKEFIETSIATMRKYQKIEQIYQKRNEVNDFSYNQAMREIGEAIEDED